MRHHLASSQVLGSLRITRRRAGKVDVETKVSRTNQRTSRPAVACKAYPGTVCLCGSAVMSCKRPSTGAANYSHALQITRRSSRLIKWALIFWDLLSRAATMTTQRNARLTRPSSERGLRRARPPPSPSRCYYVLFQPDVHIRDWLARTGLIFCTVVVEFRGTWREMLTG